MHKVRTSLKMLATNHESHSRCLPFIENIQHGRLNAFSSLVVGSSAVALARCIIKSGNWSRPVRLSTLRPYFDAEL